MPYEFDGFTLDERLFQLRRGEAEVPLRPQAFDALHLLVAESPRVVGKAELLDRVWKGARITENAITQCIRDVRRALGDAAGDGGHVQTVHGRGFRFSAEVTRKVLPFPGTWARDGAAPHAAAVLPFVALTGDAREAELGRGLAESVTRALAVRKTVPIISASSTWSYERGSRPLSVVGADLGALTIVEGRVHVTGPKVRVAVHVSDALRGTAVWSEQFDAAGGDVLALEDELGAAVSGALHPELVRVASERTADVPEESLEARLLVVRGLEHFYRRTREDNQIAIRHFTRSMTRDPRGAAAPYYLGLSHYFNVYYQWHADFDGELERACAAAVRCRSLAPADATGHLLEGLVHLFSGSGTRARASAEMAVEANPSLAEARALLGRILALGGDADRAIEHLGIALRLSPRDPWPSDLVSALAIAEFSRERYPDSVRHAERAAHQAPGLLSNHLLLAAGRALGGDPEGAAEAAAAVRRLASFSPAPLERVLSSSPPSLRARFFRGLSLSGLSVS